MRANERRNERTTKCECEVPKYQLYANTNVVGCPLLLKFLRSEERERAVCGA